MVNPLPDARFAGSIPDLYDSLLVPMIFAPYAADIARRVAALRPTRVLETAAGTGAVTRALARTLPGSATLVATDLNPPMLKRAQLSDINRPVQWQQADAQQLPFDDGWFDVVVCQFGAMFFPDKPRAFSEARRVLRPGGTLLFNVWDRLEANDFVACIEARLAELLPDDPPRFMSRTPHGYFDPAAIARDLAAGGFDSAPQIDTLAETSRAGSPQAAAMAYCQGTPLRGELEARGADLTRTTLACAAALAQRFGDGAIEGRIQAHVVTVQR
jgi:SAM-dependent methyltransferase